MNYEGRQIGGCNFGKKLRVFTWLEVVKIGTFGARSFGENCGGWVGNRGKPGWLPIRGVRGVTECHSEGRQASWTTAGSWQGGKGTGI
jgi:hypothetical protein